MCDGLPRVGQHLVPVVSAQALGTDPHAADAYDLIVTHSEGETKGRHWGPDMLSETEFSGSGTLPSGANSEH